MQTDTDLARSIAHEAGQLLLKLRSDFGAIDPQDRDRRQRLRDLADRSSHELIVERLSQARSADAVLSEEGKDGLERDGADRVWIVDPLDGTSEYGLGRSDYAVHIALWERSGSGADSSLGAAPPPVNAAGGAAVNGARHAARGGRLIVGVVDLPAREVCYSTGDLVQLDSGGLVQRPGQWPGQPQQPGQPVRLVVSRSRPPVMLSRPAELLAGFQAAGIETDRVEISNVGSVGAKVGELLAGRADLYIHDSGFYEWDAAAPLAVAEHYGLRACHLDGSALRFNRRPPWVANLVVGRPDLVAALPRVEQVGG